MIDSNDTMDIHITNVIQNIFNIDVLFINNVNGFKSNVKNLLIDIDLDATFKFNINSSVMRYSDYINIIKVLFKHIIDNNLQMLLAEIIEQFPYKLKMIAYLYIMDSVINNLDAEAFIRTNIFQDAISEIYKFYNIIDNSSIIKDVHNFKSVINNMYIPLLELHHEVSIYKERGFVNRVCNQCDGIGAYYSIVDDKLNYHDLENCAECEGNGFVKFQSFKCSQDSLAESLDEVYRVFNHDILIMYDWVFTYYDSIFNEDLNVINKSNNAMQKVDFQSIIKSINDFEELMINKINNK